MLEKNYRGDITGERSLVRRKLNIALVDSWLLLHRTNVFRVVSHSAGLLRIAIDELNIHTVEHAEDKAAAGSEDRHDCGWS